MNDQTREQYIEKRIDEATDTVLAKVLRQYKSGIEGKMRLKNKVKLASEHDPYAKVVSVEALKAWIESYFLDYSDLSQVKPSYYSDVAQNELIEVLLLELNEIGGAK